jgi:hypothetical protein
MSGDPWQALVDLGKLQTWMGRIAALDEAREPGRHPEYSVAVRTRRSQLRPTAVGTQSAWRRQCHQPL